MGGLQIEYTDYFELPQENNIRADYNSLEPWNRSPAEQSDPGNRSQQGVLPSPAHWRQSRWPWRCVLVWKARWESSSWKIHHSERGRGLGWPGRLNSSERRRESFVSLIFRCSAESGIFSTKEYSPAKIQERMASDCAVGRVSFGDIELDPIESLLRFRMSEWSFSW